MTDSPASREARIVIGVDGSAESLEAIRWAVHQAQLTHAELEAWIGWQYPSAYGMGGPIAFDDWAGTARETLDMALREAAGAEIASSIRCYVEEGHPAWVLTRASKGADLLVVGSRGHGGFAGLLLGSVSSHVATHAHCPVVIVRDED
jgi:nucleotide-binding universal stress UspA family protein